MIESIRSYIRLSRLAKAMHESQQHQFSSHLEAVRECNRLYRDQGKTYSVVKHQKEELFWVVRTRSAKALAGEGHTILNPSSAKAVS